MATGNSSDVSNKGNSRRSSGSFCFDHLLKRRRVIWCASPNSILSAAMPRENRKRGKKHKKAKEEDHFDEPPPPHPEVTEGEQAGPSWIVHRPAEEVNKEAPFGYVDAEVKAYFRTVDLQIREWQEQGRPDAGGDEETDPNEGEFPPAMLPSPQSSTARADRRLFLVAALTEMEGKEKQLATDPDCSTILERMVYSIDDFVRRVFMDRLSGS